MKMATFLTILLFGVVSFFGFNAHVSAQTPYYQGKTIRLIQGRNPGGSGDTRVKLVAPYLKKYIPGNPSVISEYMDGGGGRKAANYLFSNARPDGLTIGHVSSGIVTSAVLGESGVQYDIDKFIWLGATDSAFHYAFVVRKELGLTNIEKLQSHSGLRIGATSIGHTTYTFGRSFAWLLGLKEPRFGLGYASVEVDVAIERGELDARSNNTAEVMRRFPDAFKKAPFNILAVFKIPREAKDPDFDHLPEIDSFVKSERERRLLALIRSTRQVGTPFLIPPGTPKEQVQLLREGMAKTFRDPDFQKEYLKITTDEVSPMTPEAQEETIRSIPRDAETIGLFKLINGNQPLPAR
jgi:tripartite-type tricarboxylate transporter receptor subunit TctC